MAKPSDMDLEIIVPDNTDLRALSDYLSEHKFALNPYVQGLCTYHPAPDPNCSSFPFSIDAHTVIREQLSQAQP